MPAETGNGPPSCFLRQERAFLMSSCAFFSAFRASPLAFTSGFRARMAFSRLRAFGGAWHDLISPLDRTAVISHFRQLNLICRLPLTCSDATQSSSVLKRVQAYFIVVRDGSSACNCIVTD